MLFNIAQMSNKRETEGAVVAKASAPAVQCQEGGKRSVEVVMEVGEQPTQGPLLKKKRSEKRAFVPQVLDGEELKKAMAGFQAAVEQYLWGVVGSVRAVPVITHLLRQHA